MQGFFGSRKTWLEAKKSRLCPILCPPLLKAFGRKAANRESNARNQVCLSKIEGWLLFFGGQLRRSGSPLLRGLRFCPIVRPRDAGISFVQDCDRVQLGMGS